MKGAMHIQRQDAASRRSKRLSTRCGTLGPRLAPVVRAWQVLRHIVVGISGSHVQVVNGPVGNVARLAIAEAEISLCLVARHSDTPALGLSPARSGLWVSLTLGQRLGDGVGRTLDLVALLTGAVAEGWICVGIIGGLELSEWKRASDHSLEALGTWLAILTEVVLWCLLAVAEVVEVSILERCTKGFLGALGLCASLAILETAACERRRGVDWLIENLNGIIDGALDLVTRHSDTLALGLPPARIGLGLS